MALDLQSHLLSEEIRSVLALGKTGILEVSSRAGGQGHLLPRRPGGVRLLEPRGGPPRREPHPPGPHQPRRLRRRLQAGDGPTKRRIGQALVGAGLISEDELGKLVAHQVESIILSLFHWTSGEMRFHESNDAVPPDLSPRPLDASPAPRGHPASIPTRRACSRPWATAGASCARRGSRPSTTRGCPCRWSSARCSTRRRGGPASPTSWPVPPRGPDSPAPSTRWWPAASWRTRRARRPCAPMVPEVDARTFRVAMPEPPAAPPAGPPGSRRARPRWPRRPPAPQRPRRPPRARRARPRARRRASGRGPRRRARRPAPPLRGPAAGDPLCGAGPAARRHRGRRVGRLRPPERRPGPPLEEPGRRRRGSPRPCSP